MTSMRSRLKDVERQWKRIRRAVTVQLWATANADKAAELREASTNDDEYHRTAFREIIRTGGKLGTCAATTYVVQLAHGALTQASLCTSSATF